MVVNVITILLIEVGMEMVADAALLGLATAVAFDQNCALVPFVLERLVVPCKVMVTLCFTLAVLYASTVIRWEASTS